MRAHGVVLPSKSTSITNMADQCLYGVDSIDPPPAFENGDTRTFLSTTYVLRVVLRTLSYCHEG